MNKFKENFEWAADLYLRIRPSKLQRTAGYVTFFGLALLFVSFNDVVFETFLAPVGFDRDGLSAPIFGFSLVALALLVLLVDKFLQRIETRTYAQDRELFQSIQRMLPWAALDTCLNNMHNHWYWKEEYETLAELHYFLADEVNRFVDKRLVHRFQNFYKELIKLHRIMELDFFVEDQRASRFLFHPNIAPGRTGLPNDTFFKKEVNLNDTIKSFEEAYKKFIGEGRTLGML